MSYLVEKIEKEFVSFYVKATRKFLFPTSDFENYEVEKGKVILHLTFWHGEVGIEGSVGLVIPPAKVDIEPRLFRARRFIKGLSSIGTLL
jgi:hypothetical protein